MTITVKTNSSVYVFSQKDGKTTFFNGRISGEVVRFNNGAIRIGEPINMDFHKDGMYGQLQESIMLIKSSPVTDIYVSL